MKRRIYVDTSVIGGCLDMEFAEASRRLIDAFKRGEIILVLSSLTSLEIVNLRAGYPLLEIRSPEEVIDYEKE